MVVDKVRDEGQVFTPAWVVRMVLDAVGYAGKDILYRKVMEPSFGKGAFLSEIVSRIVREGKDAGLSPKEIGDAVNSCVYGMEKDKGLYDEAIGVLDALLDSLGIPLPSWDNLVCGDALLSYGDYVGSMDYCVGNPPYVRVHNVGREYRKVFGGFRFADGTVNLYVLFYEIGIRMLKDGVGKLSFVTPNTFLQNASQRKFRNFLVDGRLLSAIYNFGDSRVFDADTYTCICVLDKGSDRWKRDSLEYRRYRMRDLKVRNRIGYDRLQGRLGNSVWKLDSVEDILFLEEVARRPVKLKDVACLQNGVCTNCDSVFIGRAFLDREGNVPYLGKHTDACRTVWFNGHEMESGMLHRCVKASRFDGEINNSYILFPYVNDGRVVNESDGSVFENAYALCPEAVLRRDFPLCYRYLSLHRERLSARDLEDGAVWYSFARSQGIMRSGRPKLAFRRFVTDSGKDGNPLGIYVLDADVVVYSGFFLTVDKPEFFVYDDGRLMFRDVFYTEILEKVMHMVLSRDFLRYCVLNGHDMRGGYMSLSSRVVKDYRIGDGFPF